MKCKTINDCINLLKNAKSFSEVYDIVNSFPKKFGKWNISINDEQLSVIHEHYYNKKCSKKTTEKFVFSKK